MTDFRSMGLPEKLLQSLDRLNLTTPTEIQEKSIPIAMQGKDIIASAPTGTGKTASFLIPVITKLLSSEDSVALIITPTRELAMQVKSNADQLLGGKASDIKTALLIGGDPIAKQIFQLKVRPRIIVGTPGRISDHLSRRTVRLNKVAFVVLDETDRMLDMGFRDELDKILASVPEQRQTFMFSATFPQNIIKLSERYLKDATRISVGSSTKAAVDIKQEVINLTPQEKYGELITQLVKRDGSIIVFVKTKLDADQLAYKLRDEKHNAVAMHGDLNQSKRSRVISSFKNGKNSILVATDVAARGLDIDHVRHVINYDLPQSPEDYVHRIGRTGRAGATGEAISLITPQDRIKWRRICQFMNPEDYHGKDRDSNTENTRKPYRNKGDRRFSNNNTNNSNANNRGRRPRKNNNYAA